MKTIRFLNEWVLFLIAGMLLGAVIKFSLEALDLPVVQKTTAGEYILEGKPVPKNELPKKYNLEYIQ